MGGGVHFMTGPAGIYYKPSDKATGAYETHATFTQMAPAAHPEAYGLFIGGANLDGATQKYTYFIVRQDGKYMIKRRAGADTPTVIDWTDSAAIKKPGADGKMTNTLAIQVAADKVHFLVNGTEVTIAGRLEGGRRGHARPAREPQPQRSRRRLRRQDPIAASLQGWRKPSTGRRRASRAGGGASADPPRRVALLVFGGGTALSYYVDALWFDSLGFADVFWTTLRLQGQVFTVFAVATFVDPLRLVPRAEAGRSSASWRGLPILINGQPIKLPVEPVHPAGRARRLARASPPSPAPA